MESSNSTGRFNKLPALLKDSLRWIVQKSSNIAKWALQNPLIVALIVLLSKSARIVLCLLFAEISAEEVKNVLKNVFSSLETSNPIFTVVWLIASCLYETAKGMVTAGIAGVGVALSQCAVHLAEKLLNLGGIVKMFTNIAIGMLEYVAQLCTNIPVFGPVLNTFVYVVRNLTTCITNPLTCLLASVLDDSAQKLAVDSVVAKHMGLQLGIFGMLLVLDYMGVMLERLLAIVVPLAVPLITWLHKNNMTLAKFIQYTLTLTTQGYSSLVKFLVTLLDEFHGWLEVLWGCGLKRFIHAVRKKLGLDQPLAGPLTAEGTLPQIPGEETQISCCMTNIVQELRDAVNTQSLAGRVAGAAASVWNWLPCDVSHKSLLFTVPVATVKYKRKKVLFYAFRWKPEAPYACHQRVHVAPLAQRFAKQFPWAVRQHPNGYGMLINLRRCPKVVQQACWYFRCPVISLADNCPLELDELQPEHSLF